MSTATARRDLKSLHEKLVVEYVGPRKTGTWRLIGVEACVISITSQRMRSRYAMRFGDAQREDEARAERAGTIREAFNSPFWPFVLASTSVGQEGLDFHLYCHAVVHWNLPSNPVDMEQREGRVHWYKGYAVRRNLAAAHGSEVVAGGSSGEDVWSELFEAARRRRADVDVADSDLVPYWVFPGPAKIQWHVPVLPLSHDVEKLDALVRSLAIYRMLIG